jgi:hypothetical protein
MSRSFFLATVLACAVTGCATPPPPAPAGLAMPAQDEAGAAGLLAGYLLARGWTVRLADAVTVEASRGDEQLRLEPQLDPVALDRLVVARTWPRDPRADDAALRAFALELNEALNVGQFRADAGGLVFQSSLPFLEELEPRLLEAFLAYTAEVRLAVLQVQGDRELLAPVEAGVASR